MELESWFSGSFIGRVRRGVESFAALYQHGEHRGLRNAWAPHPTEDRAVDGRGSSAVGIELGAQRRVFVVVSEDEIEKKVQKQHDMPPAGGFKSVTSIGLGRPPSASDGSS